MKKRFILIIVLLFLMVGCSKRGKKPNDNPPIKPTVELESVWLANDGVFSFDYEDFHLYEIKIIETYSDASTKEVPVTKDMLSTEDIEKLLISGDHFITVNYLDYELLCLLVLRSQSSAFERMASIVLYSFARVETDVVTYDFYAAGVQSFVTFDLVYDCNLENVIFVKNIVLDGVFVSKEEGRSLRLAYSQGDDVIKHTLLYSLTYTGEAKEFEHNVNLDYTFYQYDNYVFTSQYVRIVYR